MKRRKFLGGMCAAPAVLVVAQVSNIGGDSLTDGSNVDAKMMPHEVEHMLGDPRVFAVVVMRLGVVDEYGDYFSPEAARRVAEEFCARHRDGTGHAIGSR